MKFGIKNTQVRTQICHMPAMIFDIICNISEFQFLIRRVDLRIELYRASAL